MTTADELPDACSVHSTKYDASCETCRYAARSKALAKMIDVYAALFKRQSAVVTAMLDKREASAIIDLLEVRKLLVDLDAALEKVKETVE